jgi:symplekin
MDPLQALTAALSVPADSKEQADLLAALRETLEAQPHPIPILCNTLLKTAAGSNDSLLRRWVLELLHFGIARAPLSVDARTNRTSLFFFSPVPLGRCLCGLTSSNS